MFTLAILSVAFVSLFLACSLAVWLGARWAGAPRGPLRVGLAILLVGAAFLGAHAAGAALLRPILLLTYDWSSYPIARPLMLALEGFAIIGSSVVILKLILGVTWRALFRVWLVAAAPVALAVPIASYVIWPHLCEPVRLHSGSMCPTLLGRSQTAVCPYCGDVAYTPWNTDFSPVDAEGRVCTCTQCGLVHRSRELSDEILAPDGFMVNKLLTPRRWDLVQFRALHITPGPDAPVIRYVKRVVGLPGEEVVIKDGGVWIDGQRLPLPEDIARLEFQDKFEGHLPIFWGSEKTPAKLAADEYFVVGDFGYRSNDSRMWQHKLDGHPPYALPASYIEGVVDLRYSPLSRWHVFR